MSRRTAIGVAGCGVLMLLACAAPCPEEVWVRDPASEATLRIWLGGEGGTATTVGAWMELHAERRSGRWIRVRSEDLEPGVRWLVQPPAAEEDDVESNLRWFVEPEGAAEFNLPTAGDPVSRRVRMTAPGTYTVWAQSHTWGGPTVRSNRIVVTVHP